MKVYKRVHVCIVLAQNQHTVLYDLAHVDTQYLFLCFYHFCSGTLPGH